MIQDGWAITKEPVVDWSGSDRAFDNFYVASIQRRIDGRSPLRNDDKSKAKTGLRLLAFPANRKSAYS
ncbi:hypothetical protein [Nostoc sp.]|uniref:hypothetical protein n=1 Tax=Nostoc sp. TaxID=1180 RepID=UPI002FF5116A